METMPVKSVDYEENYHATRHNNHSDDDYYQARAQIALRKFFFNIDKQERVLDYGCGLGQNILYLPNAVGFDISEYGAKFCRSKGIQATNSLEDLEDESFDIVFSAHVLEHHPYPKTMLEDIHKKLKTGKKLILVIPFERHMKRGKFELDLNQHLYCWNFQAINNLLLTSGFKIEENRYIRGAGYNKLLSINKISPKLYWHATNMLSRVAGIKEMMIVATKL
ncbi:MAG: class I SAM-dependent methyltransferase [Cyclobacteriaceae bacterium]